MLSFLPNVGMINILGYAIPPLIFFDLLGKAALLAVLVYETRRKRLNPYLTAMILLLFFSLGNLVSRLFFVVSRIYLHQDFAYQQKTALFYTSQKVFYGELAGLFLAVALAVWAYGARAQLYKYLDVFLLAGFASFIFVRIGGALAHYHPGKITSQFWGGFYLGQYRHEPALYEAASMVLLFGVIFYFFRRKNPGVLSLLILGWYALTRFISDFFRSYDLPLQNFDNPNSFWSANYRLGEFTLNQIVSILLFLAVTAVVYAVYAKNQAYFRDVSRKV